MRQYIVDTFTDRLFSGNPAAVCVLEDWIPEELMRNIARENRLSETAFAVRGRENRYRLRWFTPQEEIDFCGHATLATAFVLFRALEKDCSMLCFDTQAGELTVTQAADALEMDFPAYRNVPVEITDAMAHALGVKPVEAYQDRDLLLVLESEEAVRTLRPDMEQLKRLDGLCVAVTARGKQYDAVSRVFAPRLGIPEDPVTGSTHCMILPLWAEKLGKREIRAYQASERTGTLSGTVRDGRVILSGHAVLYAQAEILPDIREML